MSTIEASIGVGVPVRDPDGQSSASVTRRGSSALERWATSLGSSSEFSDAAAKAVDGIATRSTTSRRAER